MHLSDRASLKMVLGCRLVGLAKRALLMHRLAPFEGHASQEVRKFLKSSLELVDRFLGNGIASLSLLEGFLR